MSVKTLIPVLLKYHNHVVLHIDNNKNYDISKVVLIFFMFDWNT